MIRVHGEEAFLADCREEARIQGITLEAAVALLRAREAPSAKALFGRSPKKKKAGRPKGAKKK
jgi:hypothetical protein